MEDVTNLKKLVISLEEQNKVLKAKNVNSVKKLSKLKIEQQTNN